VLQYLSQITLIFEIAPYGLFRLFVERYAG